MYIWGGGTDEKQQIKPYTDMTLPVLIVATESLNGVELLAMGCVYRRS